MLDELFAFSAWRLSELVERYGSIETARERESYLVRTGAITDRRDNWDDEGGPRLVRTRDGDFLEELG